MQLIYAALKRQVVSPIKMLVEHCISLPNLVRDISCTSLIIRIADDLGILGDATIIDIDTPRDIIDYDYFRQGRWVKRIQEKLTTSTIRTQSRYLTRDWVCILCNLFWSMSRHNKSSSNLHERQLKLHRQTTPELIQGPKTLRINHMKTLCQLTLVTRTKEEIYHRRDRVISEDRSLEAAGFTHHLRILYPHVTLFRIQPPVYCDIPPRCLWQHEGANEHSGGTTIRRYTRNRRCKCWTTCKEISQVGAVESISLGEKLPR
jgi:hypothetical protein